MDETLQKLVPVFAFILVLPLLSAPALAWWNSSYEVRYPHEGSVATLFCPFEANTTTWYGPCRGINNETMYTYNDTDVTGLQGYASANETDGYQSVGVNYANQVRVKNTGTDVSPNLVGWYGLDDGWDGTAWDYSQNGNNGTLNNGVTAGASGKVGSASSTGRMIMWIQQQRNPRKAILHCLSG